MRADWLQVRACHLSEGVRRHGGDPHRHRDPQWYLCTDGQLALEVDGAVHHCGPGQHVLVSPWRQRRMLPGRRATYLMLRFQSSCIDHAAWADRPQLLPPAIGGELGELLDRLAADPSKASDDPLTEILLLRVLFAAQAAALAPVARTVADHPAAEAVIARLLAHIDAHLAEPLPRTDLAAACHCSPAHLARLCRAVRRRTPQELVLDARMRRARELLLGDRHSIAAIATAVGYATPSHFGAVFKRVHGMTPRAFRRGEGRVWWRQRPVDDGPVY